MCFETIIYIKKKNHLRNLLITHLKKKLAKNMQYVLTRVSAFNNNNTIDLLMWYFNLLYIYVE